VIERKIFNGTRPNLRVEEREVEYEGSRLLLIRIPEALAVHSRTRGQASRRVGSDCVPMADAERADLGFRRANPDFTSRLSLLRMRELDGLAIGRARDLIARKREIAGDSGAVPDARGAVLRELGALRGDEGVSFAGQLLFAGAGDGQVEVRYLRRSVPGGDPEATELAGPLLTVFEDLQRILRRDTATEAARVSLPDGQEAAIPLLPHPAVDEVVTNALIHRDWTVASPVVVDMSPISLRVTSPGGLPTGVDQRRLLTMASKPRNPALMQAFRVMGLAEESSRGFDRMWSSMLRSGRPAPEVVVSDFLVEVTFFTARPDVVFVAALAQLREHFGSGVVDAVPALLALDHLKSSPLLTARAAARLFQTSEAEARRTLDWLADAGLLERAPAGRGDWTLASRVAEEMATEDLPVGASAQAWVEAHLAEGQALSNREVVAATGIDSKEATALFRFLKQIGKAVKDPEGPDRGAGVRWIASDR
jgi:predicted HTH transcriptional regulator